MPKLPPKQLTPGTSIGDALVWDGSSWLPTQLYGIKYTQVASQGFDLAPNTSTNIPGSPISIACNTGDRVIFGTTAWGFIDKAASEGIGQNITIIAQANPGTGYVSFGTEIYGNDILGVMTVVEFKKVYTHSGAAGNVSFRLNIAAGNGPEHQWPEGSFTVYAMNIGA